MEIETPNKLENIWRNTDGTFKKGHPQTSIGRPKGKTLKEYAREYLMNLPDEEKTEYLASLPAEVVWKMAEGNPKQDTEHSGSIDATVTIVKYAKGDNSTPPIPAEKLPDTPVGSV